MWQKRNLSGLSAEQCGHRRGLPLLALELGVSVGDGIVEEAPGGSSTTTLTYPALRDSGTHLGYEGALSSAPELGRSRFSGTGARDTSA